MEFFGQDDKRAFWLIAAMLVLAGFSAALTPTEATTALNTAGVIVAYPDAASRLSPIKSLVEGVDGVDYTLTDNIRLSPVSGEAYFKLDIPKSVLYLQERLKTGIVPFTGTESTSLEVLVSRLAERVDYSRVDCSPRVENGSTVYDSCLQGTTTQVNSNDWLPLESAPKDALITQLRVKGAGLQQDLNYDWKLSFSDPYSALKTDFPWAWWNTTWRARWPMTINNSKLIDTGVNYYWLKINFTNGVNWDYAYCSNANEMRITYYNYTLGYETDLRLWQESFNTGGAYSENWFRANVSNRQVNGTYYLYCNASMTVPSVSNENTTFCGYPAEGNCSFDDYLSYNATRFTYWNTSNFVFKDSNIYFAYGAAHYAQRHEIAMPYNFSLEVIASNMVKSGHFTYDTAAVNGGANHDVLLIGTETSAAASADTFSWSQDGGTNWNRTSEDNTNNMSLRYHIGYANMMEYQFKGDRLINASGGVFVANSRWRVGTFLESVTYLEVDKTFYRPFIYPEPTVVNGSMESNTSAPTVTVYFGNTPANLTIAGMFNNYTFWPNTTGGSYTSCAVWNNNTGLWARNFSTATIANGSLNGIAGTFQAANYTAWTVECCATLSGSTGCGNATGFRWLDVFGLRVNGYDEVTGAAIGFNVTIMNTTVSQAYTTGAQSYTFNYSGIPTGALTLAGSAVGYYPRTASATTSITSATTASIYLLPTTSSAIYTTFIIKNQAGAAIVGATVTVSTFVGGSPTVIGNLTTDVSGAAAFYLLLGGSYNVTVSASGYDAASYSFVISQSTYTITLTSSTGTYNYGGAFVNITYSFGVGSSVIDQNATNVTFSLSATLGADLHYSCFWLFDSSNNLIYRANSTNSLGNTYGFVLDTSVYLNNITAIGCFNRSNFGEINLTQQYWIRHTATNTSISSALTTIAAAGGDNTVFAMVAIFITGILMAWIARNSGTVAHPLIGGVILGIFAFIGWIPWAVWIMAVLIGGAALYLLRGGF